MIAAPWWLGSATGPLVPVCDVSRLDPIEVLPNHHVGDFDAAIPASDLVSATFRGGISDLDLIGFAAAERAWQESVCLTGCAPRCFCAGRGGHRFNFHSADLTRHSVNCA